MAGLKNIHINDEITFAKKHQGETNDRLDRLIAIGEETNRLLSIIAYGPVRRPAVVALDRQCPSCRLTGGDHLSTCKAVR